MATYKPTWRVRREASKVHEERCGKSYCRDRKHGSCVECGGYTARRSAYVEAGTLRRRVTFFCDTCIHRTAEKQAVLRAERTRMDWTKVTEAPSRAEVRGEKMPDQYASKARDTIRAFHSAGFEVATVAGVDVSTLNASIAALGMSGDVYAEQRDGETVLRAVAA